jgi:integrase
MPVALVHAEERKQLAILAPQDADELLQLKGNASELDPVFPSRNGQGKKHLDRKTINVIIKAAAIKAEITFSISLTPVAG